MSNLGFFTTKKYHNIYTFPLHVNDTLSYSSLLHLFSSVSM